MLDLFSGIGGFSLAASWTNQIKTVAFCEIDPFCQKVLKKHWPDVPIFDDITRLRGDDIGTADIITGGFPCQPFSCAGKRRGKEDDRYLWPEMLRVISEARPAWVIGENVAGFIGMGLDDCVSDLENQGYEVQAFVIPACAVNAPHRRDRVWIVANRSNTRLKDVRRERQNSILQISNTSDTSQQLFDGSGNSGQGWRDEYSDSGCNASDTTLRQDHGRRPGIMAEAERERECFNPSSGIGDQALENAISSGMRGRCDGDKAGGECSLQAEGPDCNAPDTSNQGLPGCERPGSHEQGQTTHGSTPERNHAWDEPWIEAATRLCRVDDGLPRQVDRVNRLKALGNAIVPQVAYEIMKNIVEVEVTK
jgi:DNA (cytosine-5)-methyltransferase 1